MVGSPKAAGIRFRANWAAAISAGILLWIFPPFRVVPLKAAPDSSAAAISSGATFDARASAAQIWSTELPAAAERAIELGSLVGLLQQDPIAAKQRFAKSSGLAASYYFVRGSGRVLARDRNHVQLTLEGVDGVVIALRIGPVFGNTVRDGIGLLDVNSFPGVDEFNALSAELNALVEREVQPTLKASAIVGATVRFAGCAEAPESLPDAAEALLKIVPIHAVVNQ